MLRETYTYCKPGDAQHHALLLAICLVDNRLEFILVDIMELQVISEKLNNTYVAN